MSINAKAAFNIINRYNFIINYIFFLNAAYKDLIKKNYLGKAFFDKLTEFLNNTLFINLCRQPAPKFNVQFLNADIIPLLFQNRIISAFSKKDFNSIIHEFENSQNINLKFLEGFYNILVNSFYNTKLKYNIFSIFKSKDKIENYYYLLLGNIMLEKELSGKFKYDFYYIFNHYKNLQYTPIGNYFIFVKFSVSNFSVNHDNLSNLLRQLNNNTYINRDKKIKLHNVKYFATEADIDNTFELVQDNILGNLL